MRSTLTRRRVSGRQREDRVAVADRVRGHDRAGEAVLRHLRDLRGLRLGQLAHWWRRRRGWCSAIGSWLRTHGCRRASSRGRRRSRLAVLGSRAGDDLPGRRIDDVAARVDGDERGDDEAVGQRDRALPMPPFIARFMPAILPTVAPAPAPTLPSATGAGAVRPWPPRTRRRHRDESCSRRRRDRTGSRPDTIGTTAPPNRKPIPRSSR